MSLTELPICQSQNSRSSARSRLFSTPPRPAAGSRCGCQYCSGGKRWSAQFTGCFLLFLAGVTQHIKVTSKCVHEQKSVLLRCQLPHFPASVYCYKGFLWTADCLQSIHCTSLPARFQELLHLFAGEKPRCYTLLLWQFLWYIVSFLLAFQLEHSGISLGL